MAQPVVHAGGREAEHRARATGMLFRVLGSVEVEADGGPLPVGPPRQRALLGALVLHRGEAVPPGRLVDAVWDGDPPRTAAHSVQSYVSGLRSVLGAERIETRPSGYVLHTSCDEVDACRFERLVTDGLEAAKGSAHAQAVELLEEALRWWRDDPMGGLTVGVEIAGELARLRELHVAALAGWAAAQLALGRHEQILPELERLTLRFPLRERLWGHRLLALYRAGRSADALRAYQQLRERLADELGTDPSAELVRLHEAILVQDPHLHAAEPAPPRPGTSADARNPYKGLRAFSEDDAAEFFGRDELVRDLLHVLSEQGRELLAVVGPSGSGKSSVVRGGLLPALRSGALPELEGWPIATMLPGTDPFGSVVGAVGAAPPSAASGERWLVDLLDHPDTPRPLVLVIDQFEELFTLVADPQDRQRFLDGLTTALEVRAAVLRVVVTLRADLFDQPLRHPRFGRRFVAGTVAVLPLTAGQLEAAASEPAHQAGVTLERGLIAQLVGDLADQPGALPLFQYTLTELFERRNGGPLTLASYRAVGGVQGAVSRRADDLYGRLTADEQAVARQLFLRLVHPGEHTTDSRRRVPVSEIAALDVDPVAVQTVLDRFGRARLLTFDRDLQTGAATVEMAHDALLESWGRLRSWADDSRDDLRRRTGLAAAAAEWRTAGQQPDYLLVGARLASYERWAAITSLHLTTAEQHYLATSVARRDREQAAAAARRQEEARLRRSAGRRLWISVAAITLVTVVAALATMRLLAEPPAQVAFVTAGANSVYEQLLEQGLADIERRFDVQTERITPVTAPGDIVVSFCAGAFDLVFVTFTSVADIVETVESAPDCPDTTIVMLDMVGLEHHFDLPPNVLPVTFVTAEGSFLAGAAAALHTETGVVGFVGAQPVLLIEEFRAGFEAGLAAISGDVDILATYVTDSTDHDAGLEAYGNPTGAALAASELYDRGADVVYAVAGDSSHGVLNAAIELSDPAQPLWVIGVDTDWHVTQPGGRARHVLASMVKRLDVAMVDVMQAFVDGELSSTTRVYGLADGGVELSLRGGQVTHTDALESLRQQVVDGTFRVPTSPSGPTLPSPAARATSAERSHAN